MTCKDVSDRLDDYLDGALSRDAREELEAHLGGCAACSREAEALRGIVDGAAALAREIPPRRDLWPGIEARLGRRGVFVSPSVLAVAAAVIVALTATLTLVVSRPAEAPGPLLLPDAEPTRVALRAPGRGVLEAEAEFERAAAELLVELESRREQLSPDTVLAVEQNLRDIDIALREIREALHEDPANQGLVGLLGSAHRKKIRMLEMVVRHSPTLS